MEHRVVSVANLSKCSNKDILVCEYKNPFSAMNVKYFKKQLKKKEKNNFTSWHRKELKSFLFTMQI